MQLGRAFSELLDADRPDHLPLVTYDKECAAGRDIMPGKRQEVGKFVGWLEDEPVLGDHPPDKPNPFLCLFCTGRLNSQVRIVRSHTHLAETEVPAKHVELTL